MADERENIGTPEKSLTPGAKPDAKFVASISPKKEVPIGFGVITPEMERYQAMLAKDSGSRVFAALAELYRKAGMLDEAVKLCMNGTKIHPKYMSGRVALARAYFDKGMIKEAKEEVILVVSITPDNIVANKVLGDISLIEGDTDKARESFMKVLTLSPDDVEAKEKLKEAEQGQKKSVPVREQHEDILEGEAIDEIEPSESGDIIEDAEILDEGLDSAVEGGTPLDEGEPVVQGGDEIDLSAEPDIALDDAVSLGDLVSDELAGSAGARETDEIIQDDFIDASALTDREGSPQEGEGELWEVEETGDAGASFDEEQEIVDEFGILEEGGADITVEGLEREEERPMRPPVRPDREEVAGESDVRGSQRSPRLMEKIPKSEGDDVSDEQGVTITTETIADIYVKQGYFDKALAVYEELLSVYPARESLKQKIAFVKNKIAGASGDREAQKEKNLGVEEPTISHGEFEISPDDRLQRSVESLNNWLLMIRKYRRY